MAFQCDQCRRSFKDQPHVSISGRRLCDSCNDGLLGATAGAVAGGVPGGISTAGWYSKLKKLGRGASGQPEQKPSQDR
jgi:hypothetical protein